MFKTVVTLIRGAAARADEEFADRSALLILDQQIRDAAAGIERSKRALALAIAQDEAEGKRLEATLDRLENLEERAVAALQAGREDHIAPPESVLRMLDYLGGPTRFVLAGSGHIAGVVNPPAAHKYQYWTGEPRATIEQFLDRATEHQGSWWTDWLAWLEARDPARLPAKGKRAPGSKGDKVIEDAPGRYVATR